jgi:AraC-like DNA-binding protein
LSPAQADVAYRELHGRLEPGALGAAGTSAALRSDAVVLSNFERGTSSSPGVPGLTVRYVARGCENYRIGGRGCRVEAGQVMIAPHEQGAECEVRQIERTGTLGLCTLIYGATEELQWAYGPIVLGRDCTSIGQMLHTSAASLSLGAHRKSDVARQLVAGLRSQLPTVAASVASQAAAIESARPATRLEMLRRANLAQSYLHSTTDRPIDLDELSAAVGASPFRLLAAFQQCFGETPASYHRKLRLNLVLDEARRREVSISAVADEFGFAGASSFSHAYRRAFGHAPVWQKRNR